MFSIGHASEDSFLRQGDFKPGEGRFPGFKYSLSSLGTRNFVPGMDQIPSKPNTITERIENAALERVPLKPGDVSRPFDPINARAAARETRAKTLAD